MLAKQTQPKFIQKIVTSPSGEKFRVVFLVAIVNGKFKIAPVSAQPLSSEESATEMPEQAICFLPIIKTKSEQVFYYQKASSPYVSPYNPLSFFISQPTRAPSIV